MKARAAPKRGGLRRTMRSEALRETEERLRAVVESAPVIVFAVDRDGVFTLLEGRGLETLGIKPGEVAGRSVLDAFPDLEGVSDYVRRALRGEVFRETIEFAGFVFEAHCAPLRGRDGGVSGIIGVATDITERKRMEDALKQTAAELERSNAALRETEEKFRRIFGNVQDLYYQTDGRGIITDISRSVERYGYTPEELTGTSVLDVYEDPEERSALVAALLKSGLVTDFVIHLKTKDGETRTASVSAHVLLGPHGEFAGSEGSIRDTTERQRTEEALKQTAAELERSNAALRETEEKFRRIFDNVQDIYYRTDAKGIVTEISPSVRRFGNKPEEVIGTPVLDMYRDPEERTALLELLFEKGVVVDYEVHLKSGDGVDRTTSVSTHILRGPDGEFLGVEGSLRDITERKRMEEALREQARRDPLTGVLNHGAIVDEMRALISSGDDGFHTVAMADVDGLKATNDMYGHPIGDAVLVAVACALSTNGALVGRYGGDEFVALLAGADRAAAESYRQAVLDGLAGVDLRDPETGATVPIVASIGLAVYPSEAARIEELIKLADSSMYAWRRQRPVLAAGKALSRPLGGDRAAKMVGELVPLLTSPGELSDKLRLVAHRLSVGADYDAVNFLLQGPTTSTPGGLITFARLPEKMVEAWNREQYRAGWQGPLWELAQHGHPIILSDPQNDQRMTEEQRTLLQGAGLRSILIAPMLWRDELIGMLSVGSKRESAFGPRDAEFLMAVATQVTAIVNTAALVDELQSTSTRLVQAQTETVTMLAAAAEAHDQATGLHLQQVRAIAEALASEVGYSKEDAEELGLAAVLHDIGKIRVPDVVLSTAGQLTDAEWDLMKKHTIWGCEFLVGRPGFELAAAIARSHHERWDGSGYPEGLAGDAIPAPATIVSVADSFDAMISDRPYRAARSVSEAVQEIVACSGAQFSPRVVEALVRLQKRGKLPRRRHQAAHDLAA